MSDNEKKRRKISNAVFEEEHDLAGNERNLPAIFISRDALRGSNFVVKQFLTKARFLRSVAFLKKGFTIFAINGTF